MTSEVPVFQVFSDDPTEQAHHISDHMRSVMDDLVSEFTTIGLHATRLTRDHDRACQMMLSGQVPCSLAKKRFSHLLVLARG